MRKRFIPILLLAALLLGLVPSASAAEHQFPAIYAAVTLPDGVYDPVLTPDNLQANEAFIQSKGGSVASWAADFTARGILLQAYDDTNDRMLVITALKDVDGEQLFDINAHESAVRAKYRVSHGASGAYSVLGYRYDSVSWKNFAKIGRFLQLRYSYRLGNEVVRRGYQRRTVRNGHTITVDMQVFGRQLGAKDNTALNKVFDTFTFTQVLPLPPLPISLDESATAPVETSKAGFTMKGKTKPEATLEAVLISFTNSAQKVFKTTANKAGNYSLPIELPAQDVYVMTLTVQAPGFDDLSRSYNIRYQEGLIPVQITSAPGLTLSGDEVILSGITEEAGVRATLHVNGETTSKNVARDGSFSFTVPTVQEGSYDIRLVLSKKNLQDRIFQYNPLKTLSQEAREELLRQSALSPSYQELSQNPDAYDGKMLQFSGTLVGKDNLTDSWVLRVATAKTDSGFSDVLLFVSEAEPAQALNTAVRAYGTMAGMNNGQTEDGQEEILPRLALSLLATQE